MFESELRALIIRKVIEGRATGRVLAFSYDRISDENQSEGLSLSFQSEGALKYSQDKNLFLVHAFTIIESASKRGRKIFNLMIDLALHFGIKNLIFKNTDRMSRNYYDLVRIEKLIDAEDFQIHFFQSNLTINRLSSYNDRFLLGIQLAVAKHTSDKISQDVREHNWFKVKKGIATCRSPIGYRYDLQTKLHIIDKETEAQCRYIFDRFDFNRISLRELVDEINAKGYRTLAGHAWQSSSLHFLLTNPFYHGEFEFKGKLWPGIHQPYYDKSRFEARKARLSNLFIGKRKRVFEFGLSRILRCSCGRMYTGDFKKNKYVYYRHVCEGNPAKIYLREEEIMTKIHTAFSSLGFIRGAAEKLEQRLHEYARNNKQQDSGTSRSLNRQLAGLNRKKERLLDLYAEAEIDKAVLINKIEQLTAQGEKIKAELKRETISTPKILSEVSKAMNKILDLPNIYLNSNRESQLKIIRQTTREIVLDAKYQSLTVIWQDPMNILLDALDFPGQVANFKGSQLSSSARPNGVEPLTLRFVV